MLTTLSTSGIRNLRGTTAGCASPSTSRSTGRRSTRPRRSGTRYLLTNSIIPNTFDSFWAPPPPQYDPARAKKLLAEAGYPNGLDAGDYTVDAATAVFGEPVVNSLHAVGIRAKLLPLERAAFQNGYADKKYKNLVHTGSAAFGNAATRIEAFIASGGAYVYGSYPDIDGLFREQGTELDKRSGARRRCTASSS